MSISDSEAIGYGWLTLCAEDMYARTPGTLAPTPDPRIESAGWTIVGLLTAMDALFPEPDETDRTLWPDPGKRVFYGFLVRNKADPTLFTAAIRGTSGMVEWVIDAEFPLAPHPAYPQASVERGFWSVYQTMSLADPLTGATTHQNAAEGVAALVGAGSVVVTGHSLGSALATYFALALAVRMPTQVSACLFASPRTGDAAWVAIFDQHVGDYRLFNYLLDVVPHVPTFGYSALSKVTVIDPSTAQAGIRLDLLCNHHLIDYCAMINFAVEQSEPLTGADAESAQCILGGAAQVPEAAKALAVLLRDFTGATGAGLALLRGLHGANLARGVALNATTVVFATSVAVTPVAPIMPKD